MEGYAPVEIKSIKPYKVAEIFNKEADKFYLCKVNFISFDESGKEKKTLSRMLVGSDSVDSATDYLNVELSKGLADYEIMSVSETKITEIFD